MKTSLAILSALLGANSISIATNAEATTPCPVGTRYVRDDSATPTTTGGDSTAATGGDSTAPSGTCP